MIKKLINFFRQLALVIKRKEAICMNGEIEVEKIEKTLEVTKCEKALILSNGVAIGESFINDGELNATDRNYLMIIIYKFNIIEGYSEVSISDFLKCTNTTNRGNVTKVLERLENKNVIKKIKGCAKDSNRFLVLKHMLIIGESRVKYDTSNINVTSDQSVAKEIEYKDITFKEVSKDKELSSKYTALMLKDTCYKNIRELNRISQNYRELEVRADEFIEKVEKR